MKKQPIKKLVIDGDILAFKAASVVEKRTVNVIFKPTGSIREFESRTEFYGRDRKKSGGWLGETNKERIKEGKKPLSLDLFDFEDVQTVEPLSHAITVLKQMIDGILHRVGCFDYQLYLGETNNFRLDVATVAEYKGNRKDMIRPLHLDEVKRYMREKLNAITPDGYETDDALTILVYNDPSLCQVTNDKDSRQVAGWFFDPDKMEKPFFVPHKGIGKIWLDQSNKVRAYGHKSFWLQMLIGDRVDNICPKKLCNVRFGEKNALDYLGPIRSEKELVEAVINKYKDWYPEPVEYEHWDTGEKITKNYLEVMDEMGKLLWMKRSPDDEFSINRVIDRLGIEV